MQTPSEGLANKKLVMESIHSQPNISFFSAFLTNNDDMIAFDRKSYINLWRLAESTNWMHMVIKDYYTNHDPHTKHEGIFTGEPAPVFPVNKK